MEKAFFSALFLLLLVSRGAPEKNGSEISTAFTAGWTTPSDSVSETTEGRGRADLNGSGTTAEVGLNQTQSPTDGELQSNTTRTRFSERGRINYLWYYIGLCCFFAISCSFSLPCCPKLPTEEMSRSSSEMEESRSECDSISSTDAVISVTPEASEDSP